MGKEEKIKKKEGKDSGGLEGEEDEMKTGGDSKRGGEERKESLGRIWENQNRRAVVEVG